MALNWNIEKVAADYTQDDVWVVTETLIWSTMIIELGEITKSNWREFYSRIYAYETINGSWIRRGAEQRPITPEDVYSHIGLHTNVGDISKAKWKSKLDRILRDRAGDQLERFDLEFEELGPDDREQIRRDAEQEREQLNDQSDRYSDLHREQRDEERRFDEAYHD